jgi:hypothetical protein
MHSRNPKAYMKAQLALVSAIHVPASAGQAKKKKRLFPSFERPFLSSKLNISTLSGVEYCHS